VTVSAYQPTPLADAWVRVVDGTSTPEVVLGNFLDDWRRFPDAQLRAALIRAPIPRTPDLTRHRWDCFVAATVEYLTVRDRVETPAWVFWDAWTLDEPWFLFSYWKLRAWQLAVTPPPWKRRRIFGGDETALIGRV
jgi:hypothetical protein